MAPKLKRASYANAIDFVAWNEDIGESIESAVGAITIGLIASVWAKTREEVAQDVFALRARAGK